MELTPFPELKTERLNLRKLEEVDCDMVLYLRSDKIVNEFIKRPKTESIEDALNFIKKINKGIVDNEWLYWSITLKDNPKMMGTICLWNFSNNRKVAEVGYDLSPKFQRKGIMSEALKCVVEFGFDILKLNTIEEFTHKENLSSTKLLLKNKFKLIAGRIDEDNLDNIIFEIEKAS